MRGLLHTCILVLLAVSLLFSFGCMEQLQKYLGALNATAAGGGADDFGASLEAMSVRISTAGDAAKVASLNSELATLKATASSNPEYSSWLPLIEAQNLTLQVLGTYMEFKSEGAKLGTSGIDCATDYAPFISRLRAANSTATLAVSKANAWQSSHSNSTAKLLVSAINRSGTNGMAAYAEILEMEVGRNCLAANKPGKTYSAPLSKADALEIASGVAGYDYFVYGFDEPLPAGTAVTAPRASEDGVFTLEKETWFFFLDSQPWAPFGHPALYVMVDAASGEYLVANETMYPEIGGKPYWMGVEERSDPANVLYPENAADYLTITFNLSGADSHAFRLAAPLAGDLGAANAGKTAGQLNCCPEKKKYAIIMVGSNDSMFEEDGVRMYDHLIANGYKDEDIEYLDALDVKPHRDAKTTPATFKAAMEKIITKAECCDDVFIFLAGHGSQAKIWQYKHKTTGEIKWVRNIADLGAAPGDWDATGREAYNHRIQVNPYNGGGRMRSDEIEPYIGKMKSCYIEMLYASCYSGAATTDLAMPGVLVMTPVDGEHVSYGQNVAGGGFGVGTLFTQFYVKAKGADSATADANKDGTVTEKETFNYADAGNRGTIERERARLLACAASDPSPAKRHQCAAAAASLAPQVGQYSDGGPCDCCYIDCNETSGWKCTVFAGRNLPNCDECAGKKIGEICKPITVTPPQENETRIPGGNQTGGNATGGTQTQPRENVTAVCGDGKITGNEGCDYGSTGTNKCPEGQYCHDSCACKKLETSIVCGDGKISSPNEDCDGGNVKFNVCPQGFACRICKCVPESTTAQCGDGRVTPPEECDHGNTYTAQCQGGNTCHTCRCIPYDQVPQDTHRECAHEACIEVSGAGEDECTSDDQCQAGPDCGDGDVEGDEECEDDNDCAEDEYCSDCACIQRPADCGNGKIEGNEQCEEDDDCRTGYVCSSCQCVQKPAQCGDGAVNGNEQCDPEATPSGCNEPAVCGSNCRCVSPPTLNCDQICGYTSGAVSFPGGGYTTSECGNTVKNYYGTRTCYLTCTYAYLYKVTNIAGSAYCCCGMKKEFPCSNCPGQSPQCPDRSTCDQYAPSWYSPPQ